MIAVILKKQRLNHDFRKKKFMIAVIKKKNNAQFFLIKKLIKRSTHSNRKKCHGMRS